MPIKALHQFPRGFLWGCATAAHQVEGHNTNDWWRWEQTPGRIFENQRAGAACDWWGGRYLEDFDRAGEMRNNAMRISIEWSRIEPEPGKWDEWTLDRYREMLKALHDRGMTPMITLHHFTNPLWIADQGAWLWDDTPTKFGLFARKVVTALGDLCTLWCTINEPMVYAFQGYLFGVWPPGISNTNAANRAVANLLRGHAIAYHAIKEIQPAAQVGYAHHQIGISAQRPVFIHGLAARVGWDTFNGTFNYALRDGVFRPPFGRAIPIPHLKGALDWIGLQYYKQYMFGFDLSKPTSLFVAQKMPADLPLGPKDWGGFKPEGTFDHLRWLYKTLKKPIYVTEVGVPDPEDKIRPGYMIETVRAVWRAANFNFNVRGFFWWSLQDNFEWAEGRDPRFNFGLYKLDFETQERTPRTSAGLYREICGQNGLSAETVERYAPELLPTMFPGRAGTNEVKLKPIKPSV